MRGASCASSFEVPEFSLLDAVLSMGRPGEPVIETARRVLVNEALARSNGCQADAAEWLRCSNRMVNNYARQYQLRPKDRKPTEETA